MNSRGMDYLGESGLMLIPTRFVWPYGGGSVYISGSFTGWTQWPMTPVEGCPTVFQTICSLPPGYHKYKFVIDGEWRHDEKQPFVSSNIGTVNTILLTRESYHLAPELISKLHSSGPGSCMDVDKVISQHAGQALDSISPALFTGVSDADLEISKHRVSVFMSTHMAHELLPESGKVIALDTELSVKQAFHILHEQGIANAPLWDFSKGKFVGVLSALDFILIVRELGNHASGLTEEELQTHTICAWKEVKSSMNSQISGRRGAFPKQLVHAGPDDSLREVALKIMQNEHLPSSLPVLRWPICAIPLGSWVPKIGEPNQQPLAMLKASSTLSAALSLLIQAQVSSIPIVDDNDSLLDVYSRSDITSLAKDKIYTRINLEETTVHQALQYRADPISPFGSNNQRCFMCLRTDPLYKVLETLSQPGVRRLVVVEAGSKHVEGIISLGDIFRFFMGS